MVRSEREIKKELKRLESGINFAENIIEEFEDDASMCHSFIVLKAKYCLKRKMILWVLGND
jgi:hypothetical protein